MTRKHKDILANVSRTVELAGRVVRGRIGRAWREAEARVEADMASASRPAARGKVEAETDLARTQAVAMRMTARGVMTEDELDEVISATRGRSAGRDLLQQPISVVRGAARETRNAALALTTRRAEVDEITRKLAKHTVGEALEILAPEVDARVPLVEKGIAADEAASLRNTLREVRGRFGRGSAATDFVATDLATRAATLSRQPLAAKDNGQPKVTEEDVVGRAERNERRRRMRRQS